MAEQGIPIPEEIKDDDSQRRSSGMDSGRRYLPYTQGGMIPEDLLLSNDDDMRFDFLTAEEKVEEL